MQIDTCVLIIYIAVMLIAGAFGGIINYYLELENEKKGIKRKFLLKKSIFLGIGASFMVPLFLHLISSKLINMTKIDPKEILIFLGFCLVASISSRKFIQTLSSRILKEVKEAKERVEEVKEEVENQNIINQRAIEFLGKVIEEEPDSDAPPVDISKLKETIKSASAGTRIEIFGKARVFRRNNYEKKPEIIDRIIPVFEALIEADTENKYHRNHAQLAYILKDKKDRTESDLKRAEEELVKAINMRDKSGVSGYLMYEFNLAICKIANDPNFKQKKPSTTENRELISGYLRKAATEGEYLKSKIVKIDEKGKNAMIAEWFKINKVDKNSIFKGL